MPRSTRTSSTASDGAASSSAAGGGEETTDGANRKKLTSQEKDKVREQKKSFSKSMYAMAVAYLKKHLERLKTEGRGDCWLLTIMAGFEVTDPDLVAKLDDNQREEICKRRVRQIPLHLPHLNFAGSCRGWTLDPRPTTRTRSKWTCGRIRTTRTTTRRSR